MHPYCYKSAITLTIILLIFAACKDEAKRIHENKVLNNQVLNQDSSNLNQDSSRKITTDLNMLLADATDKMLDTIKKTFYSGDPDIDFPQLMKQHQLAAIEMYRVVDSMGQNKELKKIARDVTTKLGK